jgi:membrane protease subunit HflC
MNGTRTRSLSRWVRLATVGGLLSMFVLHATFFRVREGHAVVVTRFGRPVRVLTNAGPGWRFPLPIDQVHEIDCRKQILDTPLTATLTRDKKNVVLATYVVWHVDDPLRFMQAVSTASAAAAHLAGMVTAVKNEAVSQVDLSAIVSTIRESIRTDEVEQHVTDATGRLARDRLGIAIDRVAFQRVSLPTENVPAVLERMRSEREAEAGRIRSEGGRVAQAIRDKAHVEAQEILRHGREEAGRITAAAEREAGEMFARAHEQAPEFFEFWSSLQASKLALGKNATLILRSDQAFFGALIEAGDRMPANSAGRRPPPPPGGSR